MKAKITTIVDNLIYYDYILFGGAFFIFILFIILALIARRRVGFSIFLITIAFGVLVLAPTVGYQQLHKYIFKNETIIVNENRLTYSEAVIVDGELKNISEQDFNRCQIVAKVYRASENKFKDYLYSFTPIMEEKIIKKDIPKDKSVRFTIIIEPFVYQGVYRIEAEGRCR